MRAADQLRDDDSRRLDDDVVAELSQRDDRRDVLGERHLLQRDILGLRRRGAGPRCRPGDERHVQDDPGEERVELARALLLDVDEIQPPEDLTGRAPSTRTSNLNRMSPSTRDGTCPRECG